VPGIHVLAIRWPRQEDVDGRAKPGHGGLSGFFIPNGASRRAGLLWVSPRPSPRLRLRHSHNFSRVLSARVEFPSPPACGERGRGPSRSDGRVRWVAGRRSGIAHLTPSLSPRRRAEREKCERALRHQTSSTLTPSKSRHGESSVAAIGLVLVTHSSRVVNCVNPVAANGAGEATLCPVGPFEKGGPSADAAPGPARDIPGRRSGTIPARS
jgi:hypothetical protein